MNNKEFINAVNTVKANRLMSAETDASLAPFKESPISFDLELISSTKTLGSQGGAAYTGGYSIVCCVKNEDVEVQVLLGANSNKMIESLNKGDNLTEELKFVSYDSLFQRPIMGQVTSGSSLEDKVETNDEKIKGPPPLMVSDLEADSEHSTSEKHHSIVNSSEVESNEQRTEIPTIDSSGNSNTPPAPASVSLSSAPPRRKGYSKLLTFSLIAGTLLIASIILLFKLLSNGVKSDADVKWASEREFTAIYSVNEVRTIEAKLKYLGKSPDLPFQGKGPSYDWRSRNTDFYTSSMTNLTSHPIRIKSISYDLKKGKFSGKNPQDESYLKSYWTSTIILPGETVTRKNNWTWGKAQTNTLTKTYSLQIEMGEDKVVDPADPFFPKEDQDPIEFEVQFPLKFIR
ncbi:hypothetical protein N8660_01115 [Akkermansiaceae bacterium]|nr:hypothetical protein [Akkermansiaceae bacterium]